MVSSSIVSVSMASVKSVVSVVAVVTSVTIVTMVSAIPMVTTVVASAPVGATVVAWTVGDLAIASVVGTVAVIYQVDVAEITVTIGATQVIVVVAGVLGAWGTRLLIAIPVGAEDEGLGVLVVEAVVAALAWVFAVVGVCLLHFNRLLVSTSGTHGHKGQDKRNCQHDGSVCLVKLST